MFLFTPPDRQSTLENLSFKEKLARFDLLGTACLVPAIVTLLLALQWGGSKYKWGNPIIISLLCLFVFFTVAFVAIQFWKQENGTLPPRIMGQRSIAAGALFSLCFGASFFMLIYYVSSSQYCRDKTDNYSYRCGSKQFKPIALFSLASRPCL
jgi:hypothetical protein